MRDYVDTIETEAAAAADWAASKELREEFRGNRDRYMAYRRASAHGRIPTRISTARRSEAIEAANDAARRGGPNVDAAAIALWKTNANVRQVFGGVPKLADHMNHYRATAAQHSPQPPAAA